ncbi:GMC oxidoreductase [Paramyrothecium foliicola]|nr:GMC oxidoreductase [Paramyrothecium foliicola]
MSPTAKIGHDETSPLLATATTTAPLVTPTSAAVAGAELGVDIFLAAVDGTIALVSYATISSELDALNLASWIMTAYSLALASFQPLYGKLCDIFGRKECLLIAYSMFAVGCLACGFARSIEQLIAARVLQAVGGGGLGTVISILLTSLVSPKDRGIWQGILNIVYALGAGVGAPLGGLLATSVGWRWSFFGQVPLCLIAILLVTFCLDGDIGRVKGQEEQQTLVSKLRRVDFLGSGSLIVMIAAFIFGLDRGSNVSWTVPETYVSFLTAALAATWFFYVETRVAREPIMPLAVIFSAGLLPIYVAAFFCFVAIMSLDFVIPLYYQARQHFSPQKASFYMLPALAAGVFAALSTGFWMRRSGQYYWALILACTLQIMGAIIAFLLTGPVAESTAGLITSQVVTELGVGNAVVSGLIGVIANSSENSVAIATAMYYSIRNLGCVLGVSVVSTVIQQALRNIMVIELQPHNVDVDAIVEEVRKSLDSLRTLDPKIAAIVRECYGKAINRGILVILVMASLTMIPASQVRGGKKKISDSKSAEHSSENESVSTVHDNNPLVQITMLELHCSGSPYEIGIQHGSQAKDKVHSSLSFYNNLFQKTCSMEWADVCDEASKYIGPLTKHFDAYTEEMRGIADGAGVSFLDILALNVRTEITFGLFTQRKASPPLDGCTSLAYVLDSGTSVLAQNWDWQKEQSESLFVCHIEQVGKPKFVMVTEGGIIGKLGFNERGVGVCMNAIRAKTVNTLQLPVHLALRMILESESRQEAIQDLQNCGIAGSAHILVGDATGSTGLECTSIGIKRIEMDHERKVVHSNHLILEHPRAEESPWLQDSPFRLARMEELLSAKLKESPGIDEIFELFKDEEGYPASINRLQVNGCETQTLFTIRMDLTARRGSLQTPSAIMTVAYLKAFATWACFVSVTTAQSEHALRDLKSLNARYDYVVVGGGTSGLVVANRLSENPNNTVLVVEYGDFANTINVTVPFYTTLDQSSRLYDVNSVPQTNLAGRVAPLRIGNVVGGSSTVNGMAWDRGSAIDYDSWEQLGNVGWGWDTLLKYFRKSSRFGPPASEFIDQYGYEWTPSAYGNGPIEVGYPSWQWPAAEPMAKAWTEDLDTRRLKDGADGKNVGIAWLPQNSDGKKATRSSAETAYYNPVSSRPNLHLLVRHYGAAVRFNGKTTSGVQITGRDGKQSKFIRSKNVVLAAGAVNTPRILQLSGIGPASLLKQYGIKVVVDLPGVGANFQDHPSFMMFYQFNNNTPINPNSMNDPEFANAAWEEYQANKTGPLSHAWGNHIVFESLQGLDSQYEAIADSLQGQEPLAYLPTIYAEYPSLLRGFLKQRRILHSQLKNPEAGVLEVTFGGSTAVLVAVQKQLSRGTVWINSNDADPSIAPHIDFQTAANPIDMIMARLGLRRAREFMSSDTVASLEPVETYPGPSVDSDVEIENTMREALLRPSFDHPVGTAAMMPKEFGGVVNTKLQVYGVQGLWVVDASVMPLVPAAHTQATVYAVAEYAADLILSDY